MKALTSPSKKSRRNSAFTLVEVVLSLGVVSFALISMLGLLTAGLKVYHDAITDTVETQITQDLSNQLMLANYSTLSQVTVSTNYYFTQEGIQTNSANAIYTATLSSPVNLIVPGGDSTTSANTLRFVLSLTAKSSPNTTNAIPIHIANNGT